MVGEKVNVPLFAPSMGKEDVDVRSGRLEILRSAEPAPTRRLATCPKPSSPARSCVRPGRSERPAPRVHRRCAALPRRPPPHLRSSASRPASSGRERSHPPSPALPSVARPQASCDHHRQAPASGSSCRPATPAAHPSRSRGPGSHRRKRRNHTPMAALAASARLRSSRACRYPGGTARRSPAGPVALTHKSGRACSKNRHCIPTRYCSAGRRGSTSARRRPVSYRPTADGRPRARQIG